MYLLRYPSELMAKQIKPIWGLRGSLPISGLSCQAYSFLMQAQVGSVLMSFRLVSGMDVAVHVRVQYGEHVKVPESSEKSPGVFPKLAPSVA